MRLSLLPRHRTSAATGGASAVLSVAAHIALLAAIMIGPSIAEQMAAFDDIFPDGLSFLLPPSQSPDAPVAAAQFQEASSGANEGVAEGERTSGYEVIQAGQGRGAANSTTPSPLETEATAGNPAEEYGEYYTIVDVDSAATRHAESAAPAYPAELLRLGVEGHAAFRFIVDSTGYVDMATVEVIESSRPEFAKAVREALPKMRFNPARIGSTPVRQLAEQMFRFDLLRSLRRLP